jgi:hypothetical protein
MYEFSNGQVEKHYLDGSKEMYYPDGTVKFVFSTGEEQVRFPDGNIRRQFPNGETWIESSPNDLKEHHASRLADFQRRYNLEKESDFPPSSLTQISLPYRKS